MLDVKDVPRPENFLLYVELNGAYSVSRGVPNFPAARGEFMIMMPLSPIPNFFDAPLYLTFLMPLRPIPAVVITKKASSSAR